MANPASRLIIAVVVDAAPEDVEAFRQYENVVIPLLPDHGGRLERRLRSNEGTQEIHLVWWPSREQFERFLADPRRAAAKKGLEGRRVSFQVMEVQDV